MRIYRMTATFGKLEQQTLTLEPGLNILCRPNEWGKSTWCAFLVAMLYGLDTRAKSTKNALADKERYAPWSGSPMAGRMDIHWQGRDITIERRTRGRIPMGDFRAYETATGLAVEELTAANCGQLLLGVEQSVFRRAGFIRLADMPVTQDEALRRRLQGLVTTGDETGDSQQLERGLRELRNKCRYNRTGLIPQAEEERDALEEKLRQQDELRVQTEKLTSRLRELTAWQESLQNHKEMLRYCDAQADAQRVEQARQEWETAGSLMEQREKACQKLPRQDEAEQKLHQLLQFQQQWNDLQMELQLLPGEPEPPVPPAAFDQLEPEEARRMLMEDTRRYTDLRGRRPGVAAFAAAVVCVVLGVAVAAWVEPWLAPVALVPGAVFALTGLLRRRGRSRNMALLEEKYGSQDPQLWRGTLERYERERAVYAKRLTQFRTVRGDLDQRLAALQTRRQSLCGAQTPEKIITLWQQVLRRWEDYHTARREYQRAEAHLHTLQAMVKPVERPEGQDALQYTPEETARLLSDAGAQIQQLQNRLGQYQGRMERFGSREDLRRQLDQVNGRLRELERVYAAAELALQTLARARRELQSRFAPRICRQARDYLSAITGGRYHRLLLDEDLSLLAEAGEEGLREALWRSEGTVDQLYLALRLAVARELTPQAPLILDDALVRFDDQRLGSVLKILEELAGERQIILFTCQGREEALCRQ